MLRMLPLVLTIGLIGCQTTQPQQETAEQRQQRRDGMSLCERVFEAVTSPYATQKTVMLGYEIGRANNCFTQKKPN